MQRHQPQCLLLSILLAIGCCSGAALAKSNKNHASHQRYEARAATVTQHYGAHPAALQWAQAMSQKHHIELPDVVQMLSQARYLPKITPLMVPATHPSAKNWVTYRSRFVETIRIQAGIRFWQKNEFWLHKAETELGVPARMVMGILGVETIYGQNKGNFRVLDALATLAFDFPAAHPRAAARSAYFLSELENFMLLTRQYQTDPTQWRGSYAGAMGLPQFMPSSWMKYAIDFDGDGRIDLFNSPADAIGSVANYFKAYGWKTGMPTHYAAQLNAETLDLDTLLKPDIVPTFTAAALANKGVTLAATEATPQGLLALIELKNAFSPSNFVIGTDNFYTITRYNWSSSYAMSVIELGQIIEQAMRRQP